MRRIHFNDLIVEPYILLILEYLDDPGRCICNQYENETYFFSIVNKEIYTLIKRYHRLSRVYHYTPIPTDISGFFRIPAFCTKHHLVSPISTTHIYTLYTSMRNMKRMQDQITDEHVKRNTMGSGFTQGEMAFICRMMKNDLCEFIHGNTYEDADIIKRCILDYTDHIYLTGNSCCSGRGFSICFGPHN